MANTYTTKINAVDVHTELDGLAKVIYNVHYSYLGSDENGNSASIIGVKSLEAPDSANFTAFEDLIQDDIVAWIEPLMDLDQMNSRIDAQIAEKVAPTRQTLQVPISSDPIAEETTEEETTEETV